MGGFFISRRVAEPQSCRAVVGFVLRVIEVKVMCIASLIFDEGNGVMYEPHWM